MHDAVAVKQPGFCFALLAAVFMSLQVFSTVYFYFANCLAALRGRDRNGRVCAGEGEMVAAEVAASWAEWKFCATMASATTAIVHDIRTMTASYPLRAKKENENQAAADRSNDDCMHA